VTYVLLECVTMFVTIAAIQEKITAIIMNNNEI